MLAQYVAEQTNTSRDFLSTPEENLISPTLFDLFLNLTFSNIHKHMNLQSIIFLPIVNL